MGPDKGAKRKAILVLGMHRSGTSAITRVLNLLGAKIPGELLEPLPGNNPTGFWESREILVAHDELLASLGSSWNDITASRRVEAENVQPHFDRLAEFVRSKMVAEGLYVIKDPRLCRLLPIWLDLLEQLGIEPLFLLWFRNPLEVAASLETRDGFTRSKSLLLWLRHVLEAESGTRGFRRTFASYDALLEDWRATTTRIARDLALDWPRPAAAARTEVEEFLEPALRHHDEPPGALESDPGASDWIIRVRNALREASEGSARTDVFDAVAKEVAVADKIFSPELERLEAERSLAAQTAADRSAEWEARRQQLQSELEAKSEALSTAHAEVEAKICELQQVERRWHADLTSLGSELGQQQELLDRILESHSWKLTRPLRAVMEWLRDL